MKKNALILIAAVLLLTGCSTSKNTSTYTIPDYIIGCDVSSLISEEESGVRFYNFDGNENDLLKILSENGVNTIRIRVFNNPYDKDGNGYGGGNNDLKHAITIGKRATDYGMGVMIDFHYSDFYADPSKQTAPKDWKDMSFDEKRKALSDYTYNSLKALFDAGVNVTMVQVGNETINGLCGETDFSKVCELLADGCSAVRKYASDNNKNILNVLHFTNPEREGLFRYIASELEKNNVDYDIFATSYYPYWHGSLDNLNKVLSEISMKYNKKVMIAETSYPYTSSDSDNFGNVISKDSKDISLNYEISVEGQKKCILDIADIIKNTEGGMGLIYWEPAWIAVPGNNYDDRLSLWEKYGSGWASSYSKEYDKDGEWFGGSSWDNQALFDKSGHPLDSLSAFSMIAHNLTNKS